MRVLLTLLSFFFFAIAIGQKAPSPTSAASRMQNIDIRKQLLERSEVDGIDFRCVGPSVMSGRVVDLAVNPDNTTEFFVAYASGGLWYTNNNGTTFEPLFQDQAVMTLGAVAVDWTQGHVWVGTGEVNSSRSSYSGTGVYVSKDFGKTWKHKGLADTQHIGRILLHPTETNTILVASLGHLYTEGGGGVFKSTDGGNQWEYILPKKGLAAVEMVMEKEHLFVSTWERSRAAWNFEEGGPGSGIYHSTDLGESWDQPSKDIPGFATGSNVGRIGLGLYMNDAGKWVLYACVDNQNEKKEEEEEEEVNGEEEETTLKVDDFEEMSYKEWTQLEREDWEVFFDESGLIDSYDSEVVFQQITNKELTPQDIYNYFHDANSALFNTSIKGLEIYRLDGESMKWNKTHEGELENVVYTYGYYFGTIAVDP
ncbi:MAG: glycosyl hydrolase, partial [Bacteroidota bacterium]